MDIILYLLSLCQQLYQQNRMLLGLLCRYVPLRQWAFDDSHSPQNEKFKTDELPKIIPIPHKDWKNLKREYQRTHDGQILAPVRRRKGNTIPDDTRCPCCNAPADYIYRNNGSKGQFLCKVCGFLFSAEKNRFHKAYELRCPFCSHSLVSIKDRKEFRI